MSGCARLPPVLSTRIRLSDSRTPAAHQLDDEDYQRNHQKQVDKGSGNVETKSEEPQNQQNYENCPEHCPSPCTPLMVCFYSDSSCASWVAVNPQGFR